MDTVCITHLIYSLKAIVELRDCCCLADGVWKACNLL